MKYYVSRREFLESSLLTLCLPSAVFCADEKEIVLRFAAMSDVHFDVSQNEASPIHSRLKKALSAARFYSASQPYKNLDALIVAGDFSNHGLAEELRPFRKIMDEVLSPETKRVLCMGNHEFWRGNKKLWSSIFDVPDNSHQLINGFHFIAVSPEQGNMKEGDYYYIRGWLSDELKKATADDPKKPVFVIQHYPVRDTIEGSHNRPGEFPAGVRDFAELFSQYPQIIDFSGHSHYPSVCPRSAWQGKFSAFGTGSMNYFVFFNNYKIKSGPLSSIKAGTFYIVDVFKDNSVRLKLYDVLSDSFFDREYLVTEPGNTGKYLYTDKRIDEASSPSWSEDAYFDVFEAASTGVTAMFSAAHDQNCLECYRLEIERNNGAEWKLYSTQYVWSEFHLKNPGSSVVAFITGLIPGSQYRIHATAINCFGKESERKLTANFQTLHDDETVDRTSPSPRANFIDLFFNEDGYKNDPANKRYKKRVKVLGNPHLASDSLFGTGVLLDGNNDCFQIPVTSTYYNSIRGEITLGVRFQIEDYETDEEYNSLFGNTENGGIGLLINYRKSQLEFWCHLENEYKIIAAPIQKKVPIQAYAVFDGEKMILYRNGLEAVREYHRGPINYTDCPEARAFCLGADITKTAGARFYFHGLISYARVYSWALSPEQIKNLS